MDAIIAMSESSRTRQLAFLLSPIFLIFSMFAIPLCHIAIAFLWDGKLLSENNFGFKTDFKNKRGLRAVNKKHLLYQHNIIPKLQCNSHPISFHLNDALFSCRLTYPLYLCFSGFMCYSILIFIKCIRPPREKTTCERYEIP